MDTSNTTLAGEAALVGRSLLKMSDLSKEEVLTVLRHANWYRQSHKTSGGSNGHLRGRTLALIFEKPSLRTRVSFEVAMTQLGGASVYLAPGDISMGKREPVADVARGLSRWVDAAALRVFNHAVLSEMAEYASIPIINALSDLEHPCQALADLQTIAQHKCPDPDNPDFRGLKLLFVGDGNNVAHSLMVASALMGMDMTLACPPRYTPDETLLEEARTIAASTGSRLEVNHDPQEAAEGADVVYTDVWISMGQEDERLARISAFSGFQVSQTLMQRAKEDAIVLHCLPAHRGEEIDADVLEGPQSVVWDEAENRLHTQRALLALLMGQR